MSKSATELIAVNSQLVQQQPKNPYLQLLKISLGALSFFPPFYFQSIFGPLLRWLPPHRKNSEYNILSPYRPWRAMKYLTEVTVPAFTHEPGFFAGAFLPPVVKNLFWRPSTYFCQPDPFDRQTSFAKEEWFFLNGICTNTDVAKMNTAQLTTMFMRPLICIQNQTASFWLDMYQCAVGKEFKVNPKLSNVQTMTEPALKTLVAIVQALASPENEKVVLISHSQGTIITANLFRALRRYKAYLKYRKAPPEDSHDVIDSLVKRYFDPLIKMSYQECVEAAHAQNPDEATPDLDTKTQSNQRVYYLENFISYLKRFEVYTFANCSTDMTYIEVATNEEGKKYGVPYIENFANQFDLVARLGVISPFSWSEDNEVNIDIDGDLFEKMGMGSWGHLLNEHYLFRMPMKSPLTGETIEESASDYELKRLGRFSPETKHKPRLYEYLAGGYPSRAYWEQYAQ